MTHRILYEPNNASSHEENRMFLDDRLRASTCRAGWLGGARQREKRQPPVPGPQATDARGIRSVRSSIKTDRARKDSPWARGSDRRRGTRESGAGTGKQGIGAIVSESRRSLAAGDESGDGDGRRARTAWTSAGERLAGCAGKAG